MYELELLKKGRDAALAVHSERRKASMRRFTRLLSFYQVGQEGDKLDEKIAKRRRRKSFIKPNLKKKKRKNRKVHLGDKDDTAGTMAKHDNAYMPGRKNRVDSFFAIDNKLTSVSEVERIRGYGRHHGET